MSAQVVIRIGASLKDALYIVDLGEKTVNVFVQSAATRFETFDDARKCIRGMIARGDSWADRCRPVRLLGARVVRRTRDPVVPS